jgi:uncharacterized protein with HEPN domain
MPRDHKVYLDDILTAIDKIHRYVSTPASSLEDALKDEKTFDAVIRNLEIIGEAVKKIPDEIKTKHPAIELKKISGLRDVLVHEYYGVDSEIISDILNKKLPSLYVEAKKIIEL